jgi:hypothetical protein
MKRVSTAFVGQVSAASSLAVAKLKGRAARPTIRPTCRSRAAIARSRVGVATLVAIFLDAPVVRSFAGSGRGDRIKSYPPYTRARS